MSGGASRPAVRRPVAVIVSRFPLITETFILREIIELERQGQPVLLVPLIREQPEVVHPEARLWMERALYTPWLSPAILAANLTVLLRQTRRYLALLARLAAGTATSPGFLVRTLALFPKAVYLARRLEAAGIRHVHAHFATHPATVALVVSSLSPIRFSFTVHAHDIFVERSLLRRKIRAASFVRAISRFNRNFLTRLYPEAGGKTEVIHVGIDPRCHEGPRCRGGPAAETGAPPLVVSIAALKPYKGLPVLLESCALLLARGARFRCEVIGEGPLRGKIERAIARRGLAGVVRLLGARSQEEVARRLRRAAFFVLPSVIAPDGQMEGIPVALMEAMATRRAVVAPALSGIPELVEHGTSGLLFEPGDARQLAAAMHRLLADPELAREMGERGGGEVERAFRLDRTVATLLARLDCDNDPAPAAAALLLAAAAGWSGGQGAALGIRRILERADSRVAEVTIGCGGEARSVVVKEHRARSGESAPPAERARREFQLLSRLAGCDPSGGGSACGAPRPLHLDEARAMVVMELCQGRPLDALIRELRARPGAAARRQLGEAFRRTGCWLRWFQQRTARDEDAQGDVGILVERAKAHLRAFPRNVPRDAADRLARRLDALAARAAPGSRVGRHGDFWPGNVFAGGERLDVIDFEGFGHGLAWEDAAYFLVQSELFFAYPLLRQRFPPLASAFVSGFLGEAKAPPAADLELCCIAAALKVMAASPGAGGGRQARRVRRVLGRYVPREER